MKTSYVPHQYLFTHHSKKTGIMRLILIAALVAVSGAAKLDRTYLPPASAKTAGGAGFLQTPFSGNSFNNGLGGLPKGSFENDSQGVVVDAAAAGTRASESGGTGLGAPRTAYGSTHSKVGAAAFSEPAGFRQYDSHAANVQGSPQFSAPDHSSLGEAGFKTGPAAFNQYNSQANVQGSQQFSGPERPRASIDREASILRFESEVGPENFHYGFETDNGITAEENGVATNGVQAQGGFSYTGDDGQVYSVSYTADEGGYQPKGDHLPTPPPIPEEILKSLEQNAREEASGIVDDGSYDAQKYNVGSDYTDGGASGKYTHQSSKFGGSEADATASGTFVNNQGFKKPSGGHSAFITQGQGSSFTGQNRQPSHSNKFSGQFVSGSNGALNQQSEQFSHAGQSGHDDGTSGTDQGPSGFSGQVSGSRYSGASKRPSSNALLGQSSHASVGQTSHDHADLNADQGSASFGQRSFGFGSTGASQGQNLNAQSGHGFSGQSSQINSASGSNHGSVSSAGQGSFGFGSNGASKRPTFGSQSQSSGFTGQTTQDGASSGQFGQFNSGSTHGSASTQFGGSYQGNNAGNRNEYLPPVNRPQSGRPQASRPQSGKPQKYTEPSTSEEASANAVPLGQQDLQSESRPQGSVTSFGKPVSSGFSTENTFGSSNQNNPSNGRRPSSAGNSFSQGQSSQSENVARPNEYLPPTNNQNNRPQSQPQRPSNGQSQYNQQYSAQTSSNFPSPHGRPQTTAPGSSTGSHTKFESQPQQTNGFQTQPSRPGLTGNRFSATSVQSTSGLGLDVQKATKQPDTELTTPLENDNADTSASHSNIHTGSSTFASSGSQLSGRPTQSTFTSQSHSQNAPSARPHGSSPRPFGQPQNSAFPTQSSQSQFSQSTQFNQPQQQSQSHESFSQNNDAQFSPSTQRPSYAQQPQTADDSYYYNQPSKPFGTPETSRFPSTPSNQFNTQQPSFAQNTHASGSLEDVLATFTPGQAHGSTKYPRPPTIGFPATSAHAQAQYSGNLQGSTKYPRPPTLAPTAPSAPSSQYQGAAHGESLVPPDTSSHAQAQFSGNLQGSTKYPRPPTIAPPAHSAPQSQYQGAPHGETLAPPATSAHAQAQYSGNLQGSTKYPRPPTLAPSAAQSQYQGAVHGVTQASISPFPSQTPTQATQFTGQTQFGSRPIYQQPQLSQTSQSTSSSFSQRPTRPSFGQQPSTASTFPQTGGSSFQSQSQSLVSQGEPQGHDSEKPVTSPQYTGEIYEYNKPAQSLPPPDNTPASTTGQGVQSLGHLDSQPSRPQFGQTDDEEHQRPTSQFNVQPTGQVQGSRPQFGGQSRPQFNQNAQSQTNNFATQPEQSTDDNKPYGALAQSQSTFGSQSSQQGSHPQLSGQVNKPQFGQSVQSQANFATQPQPTDDSKPFGALAQSQSTFGSQTSQQGSRPFGAQGTKPQFGQTQNQDRFGAQSSQQVDHNIPEPSGQPSQVTGTEHASSQGLKNQFGFTSPCCQDQPDRRPQNQSQFGSQSQFGQTSFAGAQGFKPASSFAGKGEKFDASRVPPSFDEKTGYHY